jgi:copper(I)-binding protein
MLHRFSAIGLLAAAAGCSPSSGNPQIEVGSAWVRPSLAGSGASAAYVSIENRGSGDDRLMGVSTDVAGRVTLHSSTSEGGVARMRPLPKGLTIPAGETVALAPGGNHVMLEQLKRPLKAGEQIPLTLSFERSGTRLVQAQVSSGALPHESAGHGGH